MDELRVLVVADDSLARAGLAALLASQPDCRVVGQGTSEDLVDEAALYRPDVILWDLGWDPEPLLELDPFGTNQPPIVALLPDEAYAADAWAAGLQGLLLRDSSAESLAAALQAAIQGLVVLDAALAVAVLPARDPEAELLVEALTPRELEVVQLLAEGLSNRAIAHRLEISEHTVKFHVNAILGKLDAQSRTEAVVRATRVGLILL